MLKRSLRKAGKNPILVGLDGKTFQSFLESFLFWLSNELSSQHLQQIANKIIVTIDVFKKPFDVWRGTTSSYAVFPSFFGKECAHPAHEHKRHDYRAVLLASLS